MYGVDAGTWNFAPGSKSASERGTGAAMPWYFVRSAHHASLYFDFGVLPLITSQRHLSMTRPNGKKATFSIAIFICWLMTAFSLTLTWSTSPSVFRYSG